MRGPYRAKPFSVYRILQDAPDDHGIKSFNVTSLKWITRLIFSKFKTLNLKLNKNLM